MKIHSKIGNRPGRPAYRTPSSFKYRKSLKVERGRMSAKGSCLPVGRDLSQRLPVRPMEEPASPASPIPPAPQNAVAEAKRGRLAGATISGGRTIKLVQFYEKE